MSDAIEQGPVPRKRGRPKKPVITVDVRANDATWSVDEIVEARLKAPQGRGIYIPLKEPGRFHTYEANSESDSNMHYRMVHVLKYRPLTADYLADGVTPESLGYSLAADGCLCRGPRGDQRAYVIPTEAFERIKLREAQAREAAGKSEARIKQEAANATAAEHGPQAADFIARNTRVQIHETRG